MKRSLAILFAILTLSIFFRSEEDRSRRCGGYDVDNFSIEDVEYEFSQGDNFLDLDGRRGSSSSLASQSKSTTNRTSSRRNTLDYLSGVKIAIAHLYSERSYSYSCDFPFEHQPLSRLFYFLRNIRI